MMLEQAVGGTLFNLWYITNDDDPLDISDWSAPVNFSSVVDASKVWVPASDTVLETSAGFLTMCQRDHEAKPVFLDATTFVPNSAGTAFSLLTTGATAVSEVTAIAITSSDLIMAGRCDSDTNTYTFYRSTDGGVTWSTLGLWTHGNSVTANNACAMAFDASGDVIFQWFERHVVGKTKYCKVNAAAFLADPIATLNAATQVLLKTDMDGVTYNEGYPHLWTAPCGRMISSFYHGTGISGESYITVMEIAP